MQIEDLREHLRRVRGAVDRAEHPALHAWDRQRREFDDSIGVRNADQHRGTPRTRTQKRSRRDLGSPRCLDRAIHTTADNRTHGIGRRLGITLPLHRVRRAAVDRIGQLLLRDIDGDHALGPSSAGAHHSRQANAATAKYRHAVARAYIAGVPDGTDASRHGAANDRGNVERRVVGDHNAGVVGHDARVGEGREERVVEDRLAITRQTRRAVHQSTRTHRGPGGPAHMPQPAIALLAATTGRCPRERHPLPNLQPRARADCLDDARSLMPKHRRHRRRRLTVHRVLIGVADAAPGQADQCLARAGVGELQLLHLKRLVERGQHGSADLHTRVLRGCVRISRRAAACAARRSECGSAWRGRPRPRPAAARRPRTRP